MIITNSIGQQVIVGFTERDINIYQSNVERYFRWILPYQQALIELQQFYFRGYLLDENHRVIETLYDDRYKIESNPYLDAIESIRERIFGPCLAE